MSADSLDGRVDRAAAIRLERLGRMQDCARLVGAPWAATTGHHPVDRHPPRRLDRWYATHLVPAAAITGYEVTEVGEAGHLTDHLPVLVEFDLAALCR